MTMMEASGRRPLSADMLRPKQAPLLAVQPVVERLARKLAEAQAAVLSSLSSAPWRVTVERIAEQSGFAAEEQGRCGIVLVAVSIADVLAVHWMN